MDHNLVKMLENVSQLVRRDSSSDIDKEFSMSSILTCIELHIVTWKCKNIIITEI